MFVKHRFELNPRSQDHLQSLIPPFGYNQFGEMVFYRTYSRIRYDGGQESWADCVTRVTNGTFSIRKDFYIKNYIPWDEPKWQDFASRFALHMYEMKWMPPGRGLWAMGSDFVYERGAMALYNCFRGETPFISKEYGVNTLKNLVGQTVDVLTKNNTWEPAKVSCFGKQRIQKVVLRPHKLEGSNKHFGRTNHRLTYFATPNHKWILESGRVVELLMEGNKIRSDSKLSFKLDETSENYHDGYAHGLVFGDGTFQSGKSYYIRLCDKNHKEQYDMLRYSSYYAGTSFPPSYDGDRVCYLYSVDEKLKELPQSKNFTYLKGFLDGWIEADSWTKSGNSDSIQLDTQNQVAADWVIDFSRVLGYNVTGHYQDNRETNYGKRKNPLNRISLTTESLIYTVESIELLEGEEEVYCVTEPKTSSFTLAGGITTSNCAYTNPGSNMDFAQDVGWLMDSLMHGVGVGFGPLRDDLHFKDPEPGYYDFIIPDTREGWVDSTVKLIEAFIFGLQLPNMIYDRVRPAGLPIKGFGGISSGPEPLMKMHKLITQQCYKFLHGTLDVVEFKTNVANIVGCCVVAGNVRRSAELCTGSVWDKTFLNLKDYRINPERAEWGWMSNNSVLLDDDKDFDQLGEVAKRVVLNGEPGVINRRNLRFGRIGKSQSGTRPDSAVGFNPCGEIPLEHREVCNLSETLPTMCSNNDEWYRACEFATFYSSTVSLLPTHQPSTNRVVARNRRIGVGIIDFTGWKHTQGVHKVTRALRNGYNVVTETNRQLNAEAGVPEAIRKTTVKPGGTTPKLPGKTSGCGYPTFIHTIRGMRVQQGTSYHSVLVKAGIPNEKDFYSDNTDVFEYPIKQGPAKPGEEVSIWEQANNIVLLQREWSDNAVSNTIYFRPKWKLVEHIEDDSAPRTVEEYIGLTALSKMVRLKETEYVIQNQTKVVLTFTGDKILEAKIYEFDQRHEEDSVEPVLSSCIPLCKSLALLPHSAKGVYRQMPEEGCTEDEYKERLARIEEIDWSELRGSDGIDERYCQGETCEITRS